jgi:formyl-CoA transferase
MDPSAFKLRRPPPALGADGEAVLSEIGYSADRIAALRDQGVLT